LFQRRRQETFNLAFLDVMSCGLGAVLMIFLIIKHNIAVQAPHPNDVTPALNIMKTEQQTLKKSLTTIRKNISTVTIQNNKIKQAIAQTRARIITARASATALSNANSQLKKTIVSIPKAVKTVKKTGVVKKQYLIGLGVKGARIAILVDHSASMTDRRLIDIITRKTGSDRDKMAGPKWQRTKKIVSWILARLPDSSDVGVIGYNDSARTVGPQGWLKATNKAGLKKILLNLNRLVPENATNLDRALQQLRQMSPPPTDIYLITDGLPTTGNPGFSLKNMLGGCRSITGKGNNISGECRLKIFNYGVQNTPLPYGSRLNVILLPIEGDPEAAPAYWRWAAETGGMMITPGEGWP